MTKRVILISGGFGGLGTVLGKAAADAGYDVALSYKSDSKRAEAVGEQLKTAGIQAPMEFAGRGEREPLVPTADEVPEPANRRVEINLR